MQPRTRSQALIRFAAWILKSWKTEDEIKYPGVRFDAEIPEWRGGYGVAIDDNLPDFVKKDNDGWVTSEQLKRE